MDNEPDYLFSNLRLRDLALFLMDVSDELEDHADQTVQALRVILSDTARRIKDET